MKSTHQVVLAALSEGVWMAPHEVELELKLNGIFISSAAVSSRMRDVKKPQYGRHCLAKRKRQGTEYFEYMVISAVERAAYPSFHVSERA